MRLTTLFIAVCFLAAASTSVFGAENCTVCHKVVRTGIHADLPCLSCHKDETRTIADPAAIGHGAEGCTGCHKGFAQLFSHAMGTRQAEKTFVRQTFGRADRGFFEKNCNSCHLSGCLDCHGEGHAIAKPDDRSCFACHKGYYVGTDYYGMAPREDHLRYQRGEMAYDETFLKMLPDVHAERGMTCGSCHSMQSLIAGARTAKACTDCHTPSRSVLEHTIPAHLEKLECSACHAAWASQEYGTFYLRFIDSPSQEEYDLSINSGEYVKSAYLKKQDAPPLGLNERGRVSPIRPQFIAYFTEIRKDRAVDEENRLLAARWKAFAPHTIRRGTVMCDACHDNPRRFLLEPPEDRIYRLLQEGMTLASFWDRTGQVVANGSFLPVERFRRMSAKNPAYQQAYVKKWLKLVEGIDGKRLQ